jgi:hypothetical protein
MGFTMFGWSDVFGWVLAWLVMMLCKAKIARIIEPWKLSRQRRKSGRIFCTVRVIAGSQAGLKSAWGQSVAFVQPGRLEFGRRTPIPVQVQAVVSERQRDPHPRELLKVGPEFQIVEVTTDSATLEWAVHPNNLEWAIRTVRSSEAPSD